MEISFQHTNPAASHDSTLLHVSPRDGESTSYLIDAGEGVSPAAFLGADDSLDGVFLTHAHADHYASLSQVLSTGSEPRLYASPATARIVERVYSEADRYQDLGDVTPISEALTPIDAWTSLGDGVYVLPVPAGHTPGAAGFLFRIDDPRNNETVTVLATGDFTSRPVGGYPGLTIPGSIDVDVLIANAATASEFREELTGAIEVLLERALSGATTLVATSGLTGVHVAFLLGHLLEALDRRLPIHVVGQAAKLYAVLDYDVPHVTAHPRFDRTDEVLGAGAITIAGPEAPTQGSTRRLFGVIEDDPDAALVQLTTSSPEPVDGATCATHYVELPNHPTEDQFVETVERHLPRHLILKHVRPGRAKELGSNFDNVFHWGNDDTRAHVLYDDGDWPAPPWVDDGTASRIRRRNYRQSGSRLPIDGPVDRLPTAPLERQGATPQEEGIDVAVLESQFESTPTARTAPNGESATADGGRGAARESTGGEVGSDTDPSLEVDGEDLADVTARLDAVESTLEDLSETVSAESTVETGIETLQARLDDVESRIERLPAQFESDDEASVSGTALRQGDLVLFRVDSDELADLDLSVDHTQEVELQIAEVQDETSGRD